MTSMIPAHDISLGSLRLGIGNPLFLIAGIRITGAPPTKITSKLSKLPSTPGSSAARSTPN